MARKSAASKMMHQLRFMVCECFDTENNQLLDKPKFYRLRPIGDKNRVGLMLGITKLLMCTDYCNEATKVWLSNPYITMNGVKSELYRRNMDNIGTSTIQSRIHYDTYKICGDFTANVVTDICEVLSNDIDLYMSKLAELNSKYFKNALLEELAIPVKIGMACDSEDITDEMFDEFMLTIVPYTKRSMQAVESGLDDEVCYYVHRLSSGDLHGEKDIERLRMIENAIYGPKRVVLDDVIE